MEDKKSFYSEHSVALISAFSAISVSIITGMFLLLSQPSSKLSENEKIIETNDSIVGCWNWSNGSYIQIKENGDVLNGFVHTKWKVKNLLKREYSIIWPPIIDSLTISKDGSSLKGTNSFGAQISGKRLKGKSSELIGKWKWSNGIPVLVKSNGIVTSLTFKGKWSKINDAWLIKWPVDDIIFMSKDGQNLSIVNQFGSVTAARDKNCDV